MGNIATTPSDVVRFYAALAGGRIISQKSLNEMRTFQPLTAGYNPPPGGTSSVTGVGSGIYAKVVVKIGGVAHVEITAGGLQVKLNEVYTIKCDSRIHTDFIDTGTCPATAADTIRQD